MDFISLTTHSTGDNFSWRSSCSWPVAYFIGKGIFIINKQTFNASFVRHFHTIYGPKQMKLAMPHVWRKYCKCCNEAYMKSVPKRWIVLRPPSSSTFNMADGMEETRSTRKTKETNPGVVYMSRLPPFMKPAKIRNIFSQYGEVGRLFLQPEGKKFVYLTLNS